MSRNASYYRDDASITAPCVRQAADRSSAECGSEALLGALERQFTMFARQHDVSFEEARLRCVNSAGVAS